MRSRLKEYRLLGGRGKPKVKEEVEGLSIEFLSTAIDHIYHASVLEYKY